MAYVQNPGRGNSNKTGNGIPSALLQKEEGAWDTVKKVGRTAVSIAGSLGNQVLDYMTPDPIRGTSSWDGGGRSEMSENIGAKQRENKWNQGAREDADKGKVYNVAKKVADFVDDPGMSKDNPNYSYKKKLSPAKQKVSKKSPAKMKKC